MIDDCPYSFEELANTVLPGYMEQLRRKISNPIPMADFAARGNGPRTLLKRQGLQKDFSGCYSLIEEQKPVYVGISRTVFQRLSQHVKGTSHFDATLAYRMAESATNTQQTRTQRMDDTGFRDAFNDKKKYLSALNVVYVEIENPLILYLFEPYCAMMLDTEEWNTFRTH